jgi:hypothetical protein
MVFVMIGMQIVFVRAAEGTKDFNKVVHISYKVCARSRDEMKEVMVILVEGN